MPALVATGDFQGAGARLPNIRVNDPVSIDDHWRRHARVAAVTRRPNELVQAGSGGRFRARIVERRGPAGERPTLIDAAAVFVQRAA